MTIMQYIISKSPVSTEYLLFPVLLLASNMFPTSGVQNEGSGAALEESERMALSKEFVVAFNKFQHAAKITFVLACLRPYLHVPPSYLPIDHIQSQAK